MFIYKITNIINGKVYIGKTENVNFRLKQHFDLNGSKWTQKYKPIKVIEIKSNCDALDEDN